MNVSRTTTRLAAATAVIAGALVTAPSPANAQDNQPCGRLVRNNTARICPDWAPNGRIPVFDHSGPGRTQIGHINAAGDDWYACQAEGDTYVLGNARNNWWAYTMADNGEWGMVSQVYFLGGSNFERDGNLQNCP